MIGVHWTISLCAASVARFSRRKVCVRLPVQPCGTCRPRPDHIGRESPRLKLTETTFAETLGNRATPRTTYSAAIDRRRFTIACRNTGEKLHSATPRVYDTFITSYASPEVQTSKPQSC
ncbi:hypothetical protein CDS [Bradyrhizobium sp.]|nr:hypothetical protein CDS [Bradyrhizobium sp.]